MAEGEQDDSQKTEDPTPKKLEEARKKGQVALSREVNNWVMLLAGTILIMSFAGTMFEKLLQFMTIFIERSYDMPSAPGGIAVVLGNSFKEVMGIIWGPLLLLVVAAFLGPFVQIGPIFSAQSIKPDLDKISPMKGFERLFSMKSIMEFVKGLLKITTIGLVGVIILSPYFGGIEHLIGLPIPYFLSELQEISGHLMIAVLVALAMIATADIVFQRQQHAKKMRMSKQEIKDEYKQTEGDPHVKAKLRGLRAQRARQRMIQNVPSADVVITNPTHYSIALKYSPGEMEAPLCVAKGVDEIALRIREVAKENGVLLYENIPLARSLYEVVEVDEPIPPEQYKAVAEVISYVFKMKGRPTKK